MAAYESDRRGCRQLACRAGTIPRVCAAAALVFSGFIELPSARADSASCLAKAAAFVSELDELLEKVRNSNQPYFDLVERYFPLRDCEAEALLDVVRRSRFLRSIGYNPRSNAYYIKFEKDDVGAWFAYYVSERKSSTPGAGFRK